MGLKKEKDSAVSFATELATGTGHVTGDANMAENRQQKVPQTISEEPEHRLE